MSKPRMAVIAILIVILIIGGGAFLLWKNGWSPTAEPAAEPIVEPAETPLPIPEDTEAEAPSDTPKSLEDLLKEYGDMPLIDAHNHDADGSKIIQDKIEMWTRMGVDSVVLFGAVSEPRAVHSDEMSWQAYRQNPERIIPFFSGFNLHEPSSLDVVKENLEKGFFGLGEIVAASTYSPVLSNVPWKAEDPMDGYLPQIYELCAQYQAPLLLHIDPPSGIAIKKLEEAAEAYPDTVFIFAHANAYNSPENIRQLLSKHPNIYADFFAGFTALNPESANTLEDFVPVMREFPDRFVLSTDSGFGLESEENAIEAMYRLIDALNDRELAEKIAYDNMDALIRNQPATASQQEAIRKYGEETGKAYDLTKLTKREANLILIEKELANEG